jgi:hypothetical protein
VVDFGTFLEVAAGWGVAVVDPCEGLGSEELLRELLLGAGFSSVTVRGVMLVRGAGWGLE